MKRHLLFLPCLVLSLVVFTSPIRQLMALSLSDELYSHIPLIPLVSGFFLYWDRKKIFSHVEYALSGGLLTATIGGAAGVAGLMMGPGLNQNDFLSLLMFSAVLTWIGLFILFYGLQTFKRAVFPLLFLLFIVPLPSAMVQAVVDFLQKGSSEAVSVLFSMIGVPVVRSDYTFHLPGLSIEVADECSGIRSSIALVITCLITGKLILHTVWTKSFAAISIIPLAILKNAIRIVTLSSLSIYVDESIIQGDLHHKGGILFFGVALILLFAVIAFLRKVETWHRPADQAMP